MKLLHQLHVMIACETRLSVDCESFCVSPTKGPLKLDEVVDLYVRHMQRRIRLI